MTHRSQPEWSARHRVQAGSEQNVLLGRVRYAPLKSLWFAGMALSALIGGLINFSWAAFGLFLLATAVVLLLGHSLGSHRKLIHNSFECPLWLEWLLVWLGVQVGLAGPLGLLRQHELRDYAQRLPDCHPYLRHGGGFWRDAWWQLHCDLQLTSPPRISLEPRIAASGFYRFLERTWMLQQLPLALLFYAWGGWGFVCWGVCARITAGVLGHWLIGYFAHNHGGMHYTVEGVAVQGRNIHFTSLLTMGECWHNNHHAFPGSARLGLYAGEWDPGWWALVLMHKLGLVRNFRLPSGMPARPELRARDAVAAQARQLAAADTTTPRQLLLTGPAANVPQVLLRWLAGKNGTFQLDPSSRRLSLRLGDLQLRGLPAVCFALGTHGAAGRSLAFAMTPLARFVERQRLQFI